MSQAHTHESKLQAAMQQFDELKDDVLQAALDGEAIHDVERSTWHTLLAIGKNLTQGFVLAQGDGDVGETFELPDGRALKRLPQAHKRRYVSIFGAFDITRCVYGTRETQKIEAAPLDARLQLPESDLSHLLQEWDQMFCVRDSFAGAGESIESLLGIGQCARTLEHVSRSMARYVEPFRESQPTPPAQQEAEFMVVAADHKGVPMRREPADSRPADSRRRAKGEKANKKRMACVGAAYTIEPFARTPEDLINEILHEMSEWDRPVPAHKRVRADLTLGLDEEWVKGKDTLFGWLSEEVRTRGAGKTVLCLMDGERSLWYAAQLALPSDTIYILDLFHVMEKLWLAAHCFHSEASTEAKEFVEHRLRMLLHGKVSYVIAGLRQMATKRRLRGNKKRTVHTVANYFRTNRDRMRYDEYLLRGYPIGSGVVEGACRHLVKDRMEGTGMRWRPEGAQAMLHLRATYLNGDWREFQDFRTNKETDQLYPYRRVLDQIEWPMAA